MKKILTLAIALVAFAGNASAFNDSIEDGKFSFQGLFGMTVNNVNGGGFGETNAKVGATLGVRGEYMLPNCKGTFVNAGVQYTDKGFKYDYGTGTVTTNACYVEIPIHVGYRYNILDNFGVYADFGPYFAVGTNGKMRNKLDNYNSETISNTFRKKNTGIQRFDAGLGFRLGAEYDNHYSLTFGFDWGLSDMYTNDYHNKYPGTKDMKNFSFSLTFGYRF